MGAKGKKPRGCAKNWQGSYWKRSDGRYGAELPILAPDGSKTYLSTTKSDEDAVIDWLNAARYERDHDLLLSLDSKNLTVAVYLRRWLSGSVEGTVSRHTFRDYRDKVENHIIPVIGRKKLADLTHQDLQALYRKKAREGYSRTVRYIHTTLSKALHEAEAADLVRRNVARFAKPPSAHTEEREAMSPEEVAAFLEALRGHKDEALYLLAVTTGMRRGELFGLKWPDLELEKNRFRVVRSLDSLYGPAQEKEPKRKSSRRPGILLPEVVAALREHRQRQRQEKLRSGPRWVENGYVFPT